MLITWNEAKTHYLYNYYGQYLQKYIMDETYIMDTKYMKDE